MAQLELQAGDLPRRELVEDALRHSFALVVESLEEAVELSNRFAPEHLLLHVQDPERLLEGVNSAGSVFLGGWSPEVAGDYASGTNHTLPTGGWARSRAGVSVDSFAKRITVQRIDRAGLESLGTTLEELARVEGLEAHRQAVARRLARSTEGRS